MNSVLFRKSWKSNYKIMLLFVGILTLYFCIIAGMYDPEDLSIVEMLAEMKLSPELLSAMGFTLVDTSLAGFLASYFYGMLMLAFPMVFYIIVANKIVAGLVDRGAMAYVLSTPNSRRKIAITQGVFLILTIFVIISLITLIGIIFCQIQFPGLLDLAAFIRMNIGVYILHFAMSSICFLSSCIFNESRSSLLFGAGIPILFLLIQMLANSGEQLEALKYVTLYTLFNPIDLINGEGFWLPLLILFGIGAACYSLGVIWFERKDLPL